jgi:hypothetical protein
VKYLFLAAALLGCDSIHESSRKHCISNDEIIAESKKCVDAGLSVIRAMTTSCITNVMCGKPLAQIEAENGCDHEH